MKQKKYFTAIILLIGFILLSNGCSIAPANTTVSNIKQRGKIILGTSADFPPFEYMLNSKIKGLDITIANEIAKDLGVELEIVNMKFNDLEPALQSGKVDMVIAAINPTPERMEKLSFSKIYYKSRSAFVVRKDEEEDFLSISDLKRTVVGVQKNTLQEEFALFQLTKSKIISENESSTLIDMLLDKSLDAVILEFPLARAITEGNEDLTIPEASVPFDPEEKGSAVAVKKGRTDLIDRINKTLDRLIGEGKIDKFLIEAIEAIE